MNSRIQSPLNTMLSLLLLGSTIPALAGEHPIETEADRVPSLQTGGNCVIRGATIHTAVAPAFVGDVLVSDGKIAAVGAVSAPEGVLEIDGSEKHLAPGVVDCHSHMAIDRGVNEGSLSITAEVTMDDVVNPDDIAIWRALAGGVTTVRLLHGSANPIGGQDEILKLRWHEDAAALRIPDAEQGIKFALGENVKRSNGGRNNSRFPASRMGVESVFLRAFERAREYQAEWAAYESARKRGQDPAPPRRDLRLDVLAGILEGEVRVHSHCYRADEILMLIRVSQMFGFQIRTLQHVLEGYKVAHEMAEAGVGGSTFSDWWAYKVEAYDAVPHNAAMMHEAGALSSINSDSNEMVRRMYDEAAKSVRYADMDPVAALGLVTLFPARQLGLGDRIGSIEVGKDADLALLNGDPLSSRARVELTLVDGEIEFERRDAFELDSRPGEVVVQEDAARASDGFEDASPAIALVGGKLHPVTQPAIANGTLVMQGGRIVAMGADIEPPEGAEVIDVSGLDVWPGMISLASEVGLNEIGSVRATIDSSDIGGNQPDLRVSAAVNAASAHVGVTRRNGVTRIQVSPQGGGPMMGQSGILRLSGDTWEEMLFLDRDMLHLRFPRTSNEAEKKEEPEAVEELRTLFEDARAYGDLSAAAQSGDSKRPPYDSRLEALLPYARGDKQVALYADNAQTILFALKFAEEQALDAVLYGAQEAWKVIDLLADKQVPVALGPIWSIPRDPYAPYDAAFACAGVLQRAGVPFAIMTRDGANERNLAFHAATAVAYGLPAIEGVRAVTLYPARLLGVEADLGSLAVGKIADVLVTRGHLLEITSPLELLFIDGVAIDPISDRQTELARRYHERLHRLRGE